MHHRLYKNIKQHDCFSTKLIIILGNFPKEQISITGLNYVLKC